MPTRKESHDYVISMNGNISLIASTNNCGKMLILSDRAHSQMEATESRDGRRSEDC